MYLSCGSFTVVRTMIYLSIKISFQQKKFISLVNNLTLLLNIYPCRLVKKCKPAFRINANIYGKCNTNWLPAFTNET